MRIGPLDPEGNSRFLELYQGVKSHGLQVPRTGRDADAWCLPVGERSGEARASQKAAREPV